MDPEILKRIDVLAEKLGATGERLFSTLVRREIASGWVWLIVSLITTCALLVLTVATWKSSNRLRRLVKEDADHGGLYPDITMMKTDAENAIVVAWFLTFVTTIVASTTIPPQVINLLAPEASALKSLFK